MAVGQTAEVRVKWRQGPCITSKVVFVGIAADKAGGLVPVVVRLPKPDDVLRCNLPVQVRLDVTPVARPE